MDEVMYDSDGDVDDNGVEEEDDLVDNVDSVNDDVDAINDVVEDVAQGSGCDHERQEDSGRRCFKSCETDNDCLSYKKKCMCDGKCGKSCINPNLRCLPEPSDIAHGRVYAAENKFEAIAYYSCEDGYVLVGLHARICQGDETWMGDPPRCEPSYASNGKNHECGPAPVIENAVHSGKMHQIRFVLDTHLRYTCQPGFVQHKDSVVNAWCVNEGVWVGPNMTCSSSGCSPPPKIPNGYLEQPPQNSVGSRVRYTCYPTFFLVGSPERTCLRDGSWDGREPSCQQVVCGPPPLVENADHDAPKEQFRFLIGTHLTYTCSFGYYKQGVDKAVCSANEGQWIGPNMSCKARDCGAPGEINNGWRDPGYRFTYPTRVTYHCNEGFELQGASPYRECQADGDWSGTLPECQPIHCGELGPPVHGTMIGSGTDFGAVVRFVCNNGYRVVGSLERTCQADGTWSGHETFCEDAGHDVMMPLNGADFSSHKLTLGPVRHCSCLSLPPLYSSFLVVTTCSVTPSHVMSKECEINCGSPGPLWNGYLEGHSTGVGSVIFFRCGNRSKFMGSYYTTQCLENGQWSNPLPQCLGQCQIPSFINGTLKDGREGIWVDHGFVVKLDCLPGLTLNDSRPIVCDNGTWSIIPRCVPAPCNQPPPQIMDGHRVFFNLAHGSRARYFCIAGYKLVGTYQYMSCEFGEWVGIRPRCGENYCPNPGSIENGYVRKLGTHGKFQFSDYITTIKHGDRLEYECEKEYKLVGPKGAACVNGKWSPHVKSICVKSQHPIFNKLWHPFEERGRGPMYYK